MEVLHLGHTYDFLTSLRNVGDIIPSFGFCRIDYLSPVDLYRNSYSMEIIQLYFWDKNWWVYYGHLSWRRRALINNEYLLVLDHDKSQRPGLDLKRGEIPNIFTVSDREKCHN